MTNKNHDFGVKDKKLFPMYIHTTVHLSLCSHGVYTVHNQSMLEMPMVASAVHFAGCSGFVRFDAG